MYLMPADIQSITPIDYTDLTCPILQGIAGEVLDSLTDVFTINEYTTTQAEVIVFAWRTKGYEFVISDLTHDTGITWIRKEDLNDATYNHVIDEWYDMRDPVPAGYDPDPLY